MIPNDFQKIKISEKTYERLWYNVTLIRNNSKFIELFWAHSHQYFWAELEEIIPNHKFDENHNFFIENNEIVENRKSERNRFLEFHYALGGLLLYSENYEALRYIFNHTNQHPPKYKLLPYTMTDIFYWFEWFYNENNHLGNFIGFNKYPFPNLNNLGVRDGVTFSICKYICILFIRQFGIPKTLYYNNSAYLLQLPNELLKLYDWEKCIEYFKFCLNEVLKEKKTLIQLDLYDTYTNKFEEIDKFISELEANINSNIKSKKTTADLSQVKIEEFKNSSKEILEQGFEQFEKISNKDDFPETEKDIKSYLRGSTTLLRKSAFTDGDIPHMNYDSILASSLVSYHLNKYIPNSFLMARTEQYLISNNSLLEALNKISINKKDIKIIAFNLEYETNEKLQNSDYKNNIIYLPSTDLKNVLYILKEEDFPKFKFSEPQGSEIKELGLEEISSKFKIYSSVVDINKPEFEGLKQKYCSDSNSDELEVIVTLAFFLEIRYKSNRKVIQLKINSIFEEQGIVNEISEIRAL